MGRVINNGEYAPSTPSGGFARTALASLLDMSSWADATLLAGDFGRNSETAILLEQYLNKNVEQVTLTRDSIDYFVHMPDKVLARPKTILVLSFAQLQKLAINIHYDKAFTFDMDFLRLVDTLHHFSKRYKAALIVKHLDTIFVAHEGQISTTKLSEELHIWRVKTAAIASVWALQNPAKIFAAITSSLI